jgi:hypothetical protein
MEKFVAQKKHVICLCQRIANSQSIGRKILSKQCEIYNVALEKNGQFPAFLLKLIFPTSPS